jgi:putative transposase
MLLPGCGLRAGGYGPRVAQPTRREAAARPGAAKVAKGPAYPALRAERPGQVHQSDFVGPCFLRGRGRFYSLHSVDLATGRCGVQRVPNRSSQPTLDAFWAIWSRLGVPEHQQIDNEMVFYGSRAHPRGMGPLIRLCLTQQPGASSRCGVDGRLQASSQ